MIKFQHVIIVFNLFRVFRVVSVVNTLGLVLQNRGRQGSVMKKINEIAVKLPTGQIGHMVMVCEDCTPKGKKPFRTHSTVDSLNGMHRCQKCFFSPLDEVNS
tara:strand:- start:18742 stop:19047 length:306 start_codon:yes stop_codon:yes gene_type:complete